MTRVALNSFALPGRATCRLVEPETADRWPLLEVAIDADALGRSAFEVCRRLRTGSPAVFVGHGKLEAGILVVNPFCLDDRTAEILMRRLVEEIG